ncbi:hypothetical protein [Micromonospora coerulea]|nr:hypothetical protein [Micromonospora veneta]
MLPIMLPAYTCGIAEDTDLVESWRARCAMRQDPAGPVGMDTDGGSA